VPPEITPPVLSAVKESAPQTPRVQLRQAAPVALGKGPSGRARNLAIGVGAVLLSTPLAGVAFAWAPRETFVAATTSLLLALLMFLALQLHVLIQKHGIFMLLSIGLLVTLLVPVGVRLGSAGLDWVTDLSELRAARSGQSAEPAGYPALVPAGGRPPQGAIGRPSVSAPSEPFSAIAPSAPVEATASSGVGSSNSPGVLGGKASVAPAQEALSPEAAKQAEQALLEQLLAKISKEDPQAATRMAQKEMQRRYPALEDPSSKEANLYREAYNELGRLRRFEFFKDPLWPLKIAEMLASREGWKRGDVSVAGNAGVAATDPSSPGAQTASNPPLGPTTKPLPGEELSLDGPEAPPSEDSHSQEVKRAMIEARKRYPAIGVEGSEENKAYVEVYAELDRLRPDFFSKGDWPIRLVELVAKREGWKRAAEARQAPDGETAELPLPK
jgi:hypothetical protein